MAVFFLDSGALAKRYVTETGSARVNGLVRPVAGHRIHVSRITAAEVMAAIARRTRAGSLGQLEAEAAAGQLRADFAAVRHVTEVSAAIVASAMDLAWQHGLRGYDPVQLSAALELYRGYLSGGIALIVLCSDAQFNIVARTEGLTVEDPNGYP